MSSRKIENQKLIYDFYFEKKNKYYFQVPSREKPSPLTLEGKAKKLK